MNDSVDIIEVAPRDGFQSVRPFIPTERKIEIIEALYAAGIRRMEATSFVSESALPQMVDAAVVLDRANALPGLDVQVLVPNARHAARALEAGARHLSLVVSASEPHNISNVRRTPMESVADFREIASLTGEDVKIRANIGTAFHCPFAGTVDADLVLPIVEAIYRIWPNCEVALCDTTGRATPGNVAELFDDVCRRFEPRRGLAFHGHDTFGLGAANALSAFGAGVRRFDASAAGLGGCPFAPGATGNVASEDLAWMFDGMGVLEGIVLDRLIAAAELIAELPGAQLGGRVRIAGKSRACTDMQGA